MKNIHLIIIGILLLTACEKTIYIDIDDKGRKVVVNSIFDADSLLNISLFESKYILDDSWEYSMVRDASISLLENQTEIETIAGSETGQYHFSSSLKVDQVYSVVVNSESLGTATAKSYLPVKTKIDKTEFQLKVSGEPGYQYIENVKFKIEFTDIENVNNFYQIRVFAMLEDPIYDPDTWEVIGSKFVKKYFWISSEDPSVPESSYEISNLGLIINDDLFDGQQHSISFETDNFISYYESESIFYYVELNSLSSDLYNYYRSYNQYVETNGSPFTEPVKVYTNIENGFGIFGGYSVAIDSVEIENPGY